MAGKGRRGPADTVAGKKMGCRPHIAAQKVRGTGATFGREWLVPSEANPGDKDGCSTIVWQAWAGSHH